ERATAAATFCQFKQ
ncbi:hypothetical protein VCHC80A1_02348B, partial [Vibrio cholerae HC-80A1]